MPADLPSDDVWPTPALIRAARSLIGIDQQTLAESAGLSRKTVIAIENDKSDFVDYRRVKAIDALRASLENDYGIEFLKPKKGKGFGVRLQSDQND